MVRTVGPLAAACLLALAPVAPARAECVFPDGARESPRRAAEILLEGTDHLGFGVIRRRGDDAAGVAELVEILFPFKGAAGQVQMNLPVENGHAVATAHAGSFGMPEGSLVFAALHRTPSGAAISECTQQLLIRPGQDGIIAALFDMWRQGVIPAQAGTSGRKGLGTSP